MSQVDRYKPYKGAAAGWGALIAVTKNWLGSENALKNIRAMLKTNQNGGFDCPGCAWGESPENGMVKFCENGAKAVNWEATGRLVASQFTALAPFSQNATMPASLESPQAQPGQSNPPFLLVLSIMRMFFSALSLVNQA